MRTASLLLALLTLMIGCVSSDPSQTYRFPEQFFALQKVDVKAGERPMSYLAQLKREKAAGELVFKILILQPMTALPMISLQQKGDKSEVHWLLEDKVLPKDAKAHVEKVFKSILYFYGHEMTLDKTIESDGDVAVSRALGAVFFVDRFAGDDKCRLPHIIRVIYPDHKDLKVGVVTQEFECQK